VVFLPQSGGGPSKQARIISVQNVCDDPQALGYHTEDGAEHIWGVVGTQVPMQQGSKALEGAYAISTILSHEVIEMYMDPFCSLWADTTKGFLVAYEMGDPVQSDYYAIGDVAVSNFVTGPWFNPMAAPTTKVDYMGNLKKPFTMSKGGYWVQMQGGKTSQKFGEDLPDWMRELKSQHATRTQRIQESRPTALAA
jgi:hypothetical protein